MTNLSIVKKVFIASPGDIKQERISANNIVNEVNLIVGDVFNVKYEVIKWETHSLPQMGRPQEVINNQLKIEDCDLFVGIIWNRFGTPTGAKKDDGTFYDAGTQEEFELVYESWKLIGKPNLMFFRSLKNVSVKNVNAEQLSKVTEFFKEFSYSKSHPGLYKEYKSTKDFERTLRIALIKDAMATYFSTIENPKETDTALPIGLKKRGLSEIYIPDTNHLRNHDKTESIIKSGDIYLIAHSGYSFMAQFGHKFRSLLEDKMKNGYTFKAILTNPWSESGFYISLGETKADGEMKLLDPIQTIENAKWYQVKYTDSLNGYNILAQKYGNKIQIRFTRIEIPSSILITDNECFFEPYLPVNLNERNEKGMLTFEVKADSTSSLYAHNRRYFDFLWKLSDDLETYKLNVNDYKKQLKEKFGF